MEDNTVKNGIPVPDISVRARFIIWLVSMVIGTVLTYWVAYLTQ